MLCKGIFIGIDKMKGKSKINTVFNKEVMMRGVGITNHSRITEEKVNHLFY